MGRLFAESRTGRSVSDAKVDEWVRGAVQSVERWRNLFNPDLGMSEDTARLRPTLTSDDFRTAFQLACLGQSIQLRETRNSRSQFVPGVFNFDLPAAFRDPVFRPSRTVHVAFDRTVYGAVRGQDLGTVRGQPIRPVLCGFGEPFTDWVFQSAMNARSGESAYALRLSEGWERGAGWAFVYAMRWLGRARRLAAPDSLAVVFAPDGGEAGVLTAKEATMLLEMAEAGNSAEAPPPPEGELAAKHYAQRLLRDLVAARGGRTRGTAGLSLLMLTRVAP